MRLRTALGAALLGSLVIPATAFGQSIVGSRHDLSATGNPAAHAVTETEICKFCHTPHQAGSTSLLWNHTQTAVVTFNWGLDMDGNPLLATNAGTTLPTTLKNASKRCLGCHDGTVAIGDVYNAGGGAAGVIAMAGADVSGTGQLANPGYIVGGGGNMGGNHPISIPYAGQAGYNGLTSGIANAIVDGALGHYWQTAAAGCDTPSGICTAAAAPLYGTRINLIRNASGSGVVGVECTSCHEPHNQFGAEAPAFLRAPLTQSALCRSCHNK